MKRCLADFMGAMHVRSNQSRLDCSVGVHVGKPYIVICDLATVGGAQE